MTFSPAQSFLRSIFFLVLALSLVSSVALLPGQGQEASSTPDGGARPTLVVGPRAVFTDIADKGKDPFFPDSIRRLRTLQPNLANAATPSSGLLAELVLKGISIGSERLALINNVTVAEGEKARLKIKDKTALVHCLQIRDHSVLVTIDGTKEVREIELRKGI